MADDSILENGVLLSQDEMDRILSDVRSESELQGREEPEIGLSQNELDELFACPVNALRPAPKKFERPKSISIVAGRAKWTESQIESFYSGEPMILENMSNDTVEILADGHCIARGILGDKNGHISILCVTPCK